ncbi:MAG: hypothetical protein KKD63_01000 [Proteobacteria bacterium]|nr:hypothetical protein [Pseudomonadota bacterium]
MKRPEKIISLMERVARFLYFTLPTSNSKEPKKSNKAYRESVAGSRCR